MKELEDIKIQKLRVEQQKAYQKLIELHPDFDENRYQASSALFEGMGSHDGQDD